MWESEIQEWERKVGANRIFLYLAAKNAKKILNNHEYSSMELILISQQESGLRASRIAGYGFGLVVWIGTGRKAINTNSWGYGGRYIKWQK